MAKKAVGKKKVVVTKSGKGKKASVSKVSSGGNQFAKKAAEAGKKAIAAVGKGKVGTKKPAKKKSAPKKGKK